MKDPGPGPHLGQDQAPNISKRSSKTLNCDIRAASHSKFPFRAEKWWQSYISGVEPSSERDCPTRKAPGQVVWGKVGLWSGGGHRSARTRVQPTRPSDPPTDLKITKLQQHEQQVGGFLHEHKSSRRNVCLLQNGSGREAGQRRRWGWLHYWLLFMAIADRWLEVTEEETCFAHCLHKLQNKRIDDFVCLQKLISSFLTPNNSQLSWILTKLLKFEFIFWVLRIGILLLQNLNMSTER